MRDAVHPGGLPDVFVDAAQAASIRHMMRPVPCHSPAMSTP